MANRHDKEYREGLERSQQAEERPILRLGLTAPLDDLRAMARAEAFRGKTVGVIVCGGNLTNEQMREWLLDLRYPRSACRSDR